MIKVVKTIGLVLLSLLFIIGMIIIWTSQIIYIIALPLSFSISFLYFYLFDMLFPAFSMPGFIRCLLKQERLNIYFIKLTATAKTTYTEIRKNLSSNSSLNFSIWNKGTGFNKVVVKITKKAKVINILEIKYRRTFRYLHIEEITIRKSEIGVT